MKQISRKALVALVIGVLILVFAPFVVGKFAHVAVDDFIADINQRSEQTARWLSYDSGWFSSTAVVQVNVAALAGATVPAREPLWLPMQLKLTHGPVLFDAGVRLGWLKGFATFDAEHGTAREVKVEVQGGSTYISTTFVMNLAGAVAFQQQSKPFALHFGNRAFAVEGLFGKGTYSPFEPLGMQAGVDSIKLSSGSGETQIRGVRASIDANLNKRHGPFAVPGSLSLSFKRLDMANTGDVFFQVDDLQLLLSLAADAEAQLGSLRLQTSSSRTQLFGEVIEGAATDVGLQRISLEFFNNALDLLQNSPLREGFEAQSALQFLPLITQQLLPPGPQIQLERLDFIAPEGGFSAQGAVRVEKQPNSPADLATAVRTTHAELELSLARSLALRILKIQAANALDEQMFASGRILSDLEREKAIATAASERLEQLLQQGYLAPRDGQLTAKLDLNGGVVTVNEQNLPLLF